MTTFICPLDFSDPCKIEKVNEMWKSINSKTTNLDIRNHDKYLAILSHAPHAISFALSKKTNEKELLKKLPWMYSKGSLSEILRVANSDSNAWASIFKDNQDNLAEYLEEYIQELKELKFSIMNGSVEELASYLKNQNLLNKIFMSENYIVYPSENINGEVSVPGDKSISQQIIDFIIYIKRYWKDYGTFRVG